MLELKDVTAHYGTSQALFGITLDLQAGQVATLLGRNGMGKTTTIKSIFGLVKPRAGSVRVGGKNLTGADPHKIAMAGLGYVPEGRQIFPTLNVEENLRATARPGKWTIDKIYDLFPRLKERRRNMGNQLSGGEQQMLAIGRALMTNPQLMVLDEATEGLAPLIRADIWSCLARLKQEGEAILVIDKNVDALTKFADRHVVIEKGRVVWTGTTEQILATPEVKDRFLHV